MKLFIIGSTGGTGKQLVKQGLEQGHQLTLLVRNPKKIKITHENLNVIKGDVLNLMSLENSLKNHDVVISSLGHKKFIVKTSILSRGTENIISAMEKNQIKRFICITSLGINDSRFKLGLYYTLFVIPFILYFYFQDKSKQEKSIEKSSLDWTIVRPVQLTNGSKKTNYKQGKEIGHFVLTKFVSRASVAHFILQELKENKYLFQKVGLSN